MYSTEYLPTLNLITCVLDFPHEINAISQIKFEGNNLIISASQDVYKIVLPIKASNQGTTLGNIKKIKSCLTVSVKVPNVHSDKEESISKWSCKDLLNKTDRNDRNINQFKFCCASCNESILDSNDYKFLDMPSEYWFELMDFWHCHKPENKGDTTDKVYDGILRPEDDKTIIIGSYYFLVAEDFAQKRLNGVGLDDFVRCSCTSIIGEYTNNTIKLLKWKLTLKSKSRTENYSQHLIIYNSILDKISSLAIRKFKFKIREDWFYLWVMNLNLDVSINDAILNDSLKVLYFQDTGNLHIEKTIFDDYEQFDLVYPEIIENFANRLGDLNEELPESSKYLEMNGLQFKISYVSPGNC